MDPKQGGLEKTKLQKTQEGYIYISFLRKPDEVEEPQISCFVGRTVKNTLILYCEGKGIKTKFGDGFGGLVLRGFSQF